MPKPSDKRLRHYPALRDIPSDEWDDFFENDGKEWTTKDLQYLAEWIGKRAIIVDRVEGVVDIAYQLGRTPFSIEDTLRRMRADGWDVPTIRKEKANGTAETEAGDMSSGSPDNDDSERSLRRSRKYSETARSIRRPI